ncbi:MAG TPA: PepSY-associated TM helix domain-containing protein [Fimbriimonadaceae bacterium]|nr:PepSY-associated TM helix domain-containing protein [Fimbriimonadaceae bacterium]
MYHNLRWLHRWIGLVGSLFLLVISVTGFLLATKGTVDWIRPPEAEGGEVAGLSQVISLDEAARAAFALNLPKLTAREHIDRIDYRPRSNIFKVLSRENYHEVQVDGATGKVLSVSFRRDQLAEDIHDLSFFASAAHDYWLPVVALLLFGLSISGVVIFFVPIVRRWRFRHRPR